MGWFRKTKKQTKNESCAYKPAAKAYQGCSFESGAGKWAGERSGFRGQRSSHGLELIDPLLGVSLADLAQRLVLVAACLDILGMQHVILRLLGVVPSLRQLWAKGLWGSWQQSVYKHWESDADWENQVKL